MQRAVRGEQGRGPRGADARVAQRPGPGLAPARPRGRETQRPRAARPPARSVQRRARAAWWRAPRAARPARLRPGRQPQLPRLGGDHQDGRGEIAAVRLGESHHALEHGAQVEPRGDLLEQLALSAGELIGLGLARSDRPPRRPFARRRPPRPARWRPGRAAGRSGRRRGGSGTRRSSSAAPSAMAAWMPLTTRSRSSACRRSYHQAADALRPERW